MRWLLLTACLLCVSFAVRGDELPADWAFKPRSNPTPPVVRDVESVRNPIDRFVIARLEAIGLRLASPAERATLIRRLSFDLVGLPPTPQEIEAFVHDRSPDAYEKLVARLLKSPQFGERQATQWLDLVRYAESDGFKADDARPNAWRYRDYVIESFNRDKPYDRFVQEQIAGDELFPNDINALVATGFLRHWPDEYNAVNLEQRRQEILNDITDTTSAAFLGLTAGCAKCHDHKYDPIPQKDYYRLQAFFAAYWPTETPLASPSEIEAAKQRRLEWEKQTAELRQKIAEVEKPFRESAQRKQRGRFVEEYQAILDIPMEKRTPMQKQIGAMIDKQVHAAGTDVGKTMKGPAKDQWQAMMKQMEQFDRLKPPKLPALPICTDVGPEAPKTHLLKRGNWRTPGEEVAPGYPTALASATPQAAVKPLTATTGRRAALAKWLTQPEHPLTARVIVNRVWQSHFGKGIVGTPSDFGSQGDRPTHPELLDWLANEFVRNGWNLKWLHRTIVTSATYMQSSFASSEALKADPDNRWYSRMTRRRVEAESLRDAMLSVSGQLNLKAGGPSIFPELPDEIKKSAKNWPTSADASDRNRRSVYIAVRRNLRYPLLAIFDAPDANETCARRFATTTAPQALMLLNDRLILEMAEAFAKRVLHEAGTDHGEIISRTFTLALGRSPSDVERSTMHRFLQESRAKTGRMDAAVTDFCHAVLNLNEFLFVD